MTLFRLSNLLVLSLIKLWARLFYRVENNWIHEHNEDPWEGVRLLVFLNHTSLYEPLFLGAAPWRMLWRAAGRVVVPAANITMDRPIVGRLFRFFSPKIVSITRERDESWDHFLSQITIDSFVMILPEGRMKRSTGLDKHGNPMSVRGGVADILQILQVGKMVIIYSGGLHHVQVPGQFLPKLFRSIKMNSERIDIANYITEINERIRYLSDEMSFKVAVINDLEHRMERHCPPEKIAHPRT